MARHTIIIGGGLLGVATLYELCAAGRDVTLLEAAPTLAAGASHANGGVLHPSVSNTWNQMSNITGLRIAPRQVPHLFKWGYKFLRNATRNRIRAAAADNYRLAAYSTQHTRTLIARHTLDIEQGEAGMIKICASPRALRRAIDLAPAGLQYDILHREELIIREPALAHAPPPYAIHFKGDMIGDARAFVLQIAACAKDLGAQILLNHKVDEIIMRNNKIYGVRCGTKEIAGDVVLAGGYASPHLIKPLGINLAVQPVKGYSLTFDCATATAIMPRYPIVDDARHIAITPFRKRIRVLGMAEFAGADTHIPPARLHHLEGFLRHLYPQLVLDNPQGWAGLRPMSADGRPFIGQTSIKGLWLNCGHGHLGWTMAAGSARLLAAQITNAVPAINPQAFYPNRK